MSASPSPTRPPAASRRPAAAVTLRAEAAWEPEDLVHAAAFAQGFSPSRPSLTQARRVEVWGAIRTDRPEPPRLRTGPVTIDLTAWADREDAAIPIQLQARVTIDGWETPVHLALADAQWRRGRLLATYDLTG